MTLLNQISSIQRKVKSFLRSTGGLTSVPYVDLPRYMGDWYVISNIPNMIESGAHGSVESYRLRQDGKIDTQFVFHKGSFGGKKVSLKSLAWIHNAKTHAEWRVQFFWPIRFRYVVIDLAPDYSYAVVAHPSKRQVWVMSKTPTLDERTYKGIIRRLRLQGIETTKLVKVPQIPGEERSERIAA